MYRFFLLNSKIVTDFPERYVLEPTAPGLQLEVRYVEGEGGDKEGDGIWGLNVQIVQSPL